MLTRLTIKDIVLIERLDLEFKSGFSALTGETGAGKSILLDATALCLGARGDAGLVRSGQESGQVTAVFEVGAKHPALALVKDAGIDCDGELIFKRTQMADGRTRASLNGEAVSASVLKQIGETLVEIHGQHAERALLDPAAHRAVVDIFGDLAPHLDETKKAWTAWRASLKALREAEEQIEKARKEEEYLRAAVKELKKLNPAEGEEEELSKRRVKLQQSEKIASDLNDAYEVFNGHNSVIPPFAGAWRKLERRGASAPELVEPIVKAMGEAIDAIETARAHLESAIREADFNPRELEGIEERLFALRAASRKFTTPVANLNALSLKFIADVEALEKSESNLKALQKQVSETEKAYFTAANALSAARKISATALNKAVTDELPPLKLEQAKFMAEITKQEPASSGVDFVEFHVQTNSNTKSGAMFKIASGGELSRFLLALKVVLADKGSAPTLIFDEIDAGVGGAVADKIGQRLRMLSNKVQVMCVTHAPQVAAKVTAHFLIEKKANDKASATSVRLLTDNERVEEVARMLAGDKITSEARAAALKLMEV